MTAPNTSSQPALRHVQCIDNRGLHRMAYWEWAQQDHLDEPRTLVCVHGLSRQGRDFDTLARDLASHYRVICPDVVGRGRSDRLADPMSYAVPTYVADMVTLVARLDVPQLDWVGTSMGGLIGMGLASLPGSPVRRLVLNDVGPAIEPSAIARIAGYLGQPVTWATVEEAAEALRQVSLGFGPHSPEQWLELTRPQLVPAPGGGFMSHYDPAIAVPIRAITPEMAKAGEALLWQSYDRITCATLVVRGAESDLLSPATAGAMAERGPKARVVEIAGVGHAPTLVAPDQRAVVRNFLLGP
ncbi:MAG: alpha/beta hydrolase [Rubrivivax sp.]|nr:alpha/beta hydrolase [Rubrivivax sp.]